MTHWTPHTAVPVTQATTSAPLPALTSTSHQSPSSTLNGVSRQHAATISTPPAPQHFMGSQLQPTDVSTAYVHPQPTTLQTSQDSHHHPTSQEQTTVSTWPRPHPPGLDATWATPPTYPPSRPVFPGFPLVGPREHYLSVDPQIHPRHRQLCEMQAQELLITIAKSESQQFTAQLHDLTNPSSFPSRPGDAYLSRLLRFRSTLWAQIANDLSTYLHTLQQQHHRDVQQFVNAPPLPLHWPPYVYEASTPQRLLHFDYLSTLRPTPLPYDLTGRDADSSASSDPSC